MTAPTSRAPLELLAAARGVAVSYEDGLGRRRDVSPETLVAVLSALGEPIERPDDAVQCLARRAASPAVLPSATVAWDGLLDETVLRRLREAAMRRAPALSLELELENGSDAARLLSRDSAHQPRPLPYGVHRARVGELAMLVISAPSRPRPLDPVSWGVFAPTYALWEQSLDHVADLSCLSRLGTFAGRLGASYLSTLPLLADYFGVDSPATSGSPYSPLSRMWWNEAYLDVTGYELPGPGGDCASRAAAPPTALNAQVWRGPAPGSTDGARAHVDLRVAATRVHTTIERLLATAHPADGPRKAEFSQFLRDRPEVSRYGAFRAAAAARGLDRDRWPQRWVAGHIEPGRDVAPSVVELHVCAQWLTDAQIARAAKSMASTGCRLMLDLPIGCRSDGYDTWAYPSSFAGGRDGGRRPGTVTVGAPPDRFFGEGQDWGFLPLDPEGERRAGYPVMRGSLRHLLRHAGALRIDHILGFQRLWWIPAGVKACEGTYVSYPTQEMIAVACLEAWRRDAAMVGEDLGTVDPPLRRMIADHGIAGMSVAIFDLEESPGAPLIPAAGSCALVDTHDTATFAGFLDGDDIRERVELGLIDEDGAASALRERAAAREAIAARLGVCGSKSDGPELLHSAVLEELGRSKAALVIVAIEDLLAERDPQNVPGTVYEHANFSRLMAEPLEMIETGTALLEPLRRLDKARRAAGSREVESGGGVDTEKVAT
ncbi:MAG: 4-alpha-glucanotransferase [Acidimicrobiales bacterium]